MKKVIGIYLAGLIISVLFLIIAVDYIPVLAAWFPLLMMASFSCKSRCFRAWVIRVVNNSFE